MLNTCKLNVKITGQSQSSCGTRFVPLTYDLSCCHGTHSTCTETKPYQCRLPEVMLHSHTFSSLTKRSPLRTRSNTKTVHSISLALLEQSALSSLHPRLGKTVTSQWFLTGAKDRAQHCQIKDYVLSLYESRCSFPSRLFFLNILVPLPSSDIHE